MTAPKQSTARSTATNGKASTAQSTSEAIRETAREAAEDTKTFVERTGDRAKFVAARVGREVEALGRAAKPFVRPALYTTAFLVDPPLAVAAYAVDLGSRTARERMRNLAAEQEAAELSAVDTSEQ